MRNCFRLVTVFIILALILGGAFSVVGAQAPPEEVTAVVRIDPAGRILVAGEVFTVEIWVDDVIDLYGADIQLAYDPDAFEVLDADPGTPGTQIKLRYDFLHPQFVLAKTADNDAGTISYIASQINPTPPASGSGVLFEVDFRAKGTAGKYPLTFDRHDLSAVGGEPIENTVLEAVYDFPSSIFLPLIKR